MTALAQDRKTDKMGPEDNAFPLILSVKVAASTKIYGGSMVAVNSSGYAVPASNTAAQRVIGICKKLADNSSGSAGDIQVEVQQGVFYFPCPTSGANQILQADLFSIAYASDDNNLSKTDGAGLYPPAGPVYDVRSDGQIGVFLGLASLWQLPVVDLPATGGAMVRQARGAVFANVASLASFTVASNDGITYVAGDIVLLAAQTTAAQNGPYVVGTVSSGTAPLTRPDWFAAGSTIQPGLIIAMSGDGTIFGGSQWKALCAKAKVVDTDDPTFYPQFCKARVTLSSGTYALGATEGLFLYSLTKSNVQATRETAGGTLTNTTHYYCPSASSARVAGVSGVAVVTVNASVAAGTLNNADNSVINVLVTNW